MTELLIKQQNLAKLYLFKTHLDANGHSKSYDFCSEKKNFFLNVDLKVVVFRKVSISRRSHQGCSIKKRYS